jgi:hypothetical protein
MSNIVTTKSDVNLIKRLWDGLLEPNHRGRVGLLLTAATISVGALWTLYNSRLGPTPNTQKSVKVESSASPTSTILSNTDPTVQNRDNQAEGIQEDTIEEILKRP